MTQKWVGVAAELHVQSTGLLHGAECPVSITQSIFQPRVGHKHHVELAIVIKVGKYAGIVAAGVGRLQRLLQREMTGAVIDPGIKRCERAAAFAAKLVIGEEEVWRCVSIHVTDRTGNVSAAVGRAQALRGCKGAVSVAEKDRGRRPQVNEVNLAIFVQVARDNVERLEKRKLQYLACGKPAL